MSWLSDLIIKEFDDPEVQKKGLEAVLRLLEDSAVQAKLIEIIDARIEAKKPVPEPEPKPDPKPDPGPDPISTPVTVWDGDLIPNQMRAKGWEGEDNDLYYVLFQGYPGLPPDLTGARPEMIILWNEKRGEIVAWWDNILKEIANDFIRGREVSHIMVIANDGPDRGGFRIGPASFNRLVELGVNGMMEMGEIYEYK